MFGLLFHRFTEEFEKGSEICGDSDLTVTRDVSFASGS